MGSFSPSIGYSQKEGITVGGEFNFGASQGFKARQARRDQYAYLAESPEYMMEGIKRASKSYGIHPLALLGNTPDKGPTVFNDMGQNTANVSARFGTSEQRAFTKRAQDLQLEHAQLQNELLRVNISKLNKGPGGPGLSDYSGGLVDGQTNGPISIKPAVRTASPKGKPEQDYGHIASVSWMRNEDGSLTPVPSKEGKERIEDQLVPEIVWAAQNYMSPPKPPLKYLPKGATDFQYDHLTARWRPLYKSNASYKIKPRLKSNWKKQSKKYNNLRRN